MSSVQVESGQQTSLFYKRKIRNICSDVNDNLPYQVSWTSDLHNPGKLCAFHETIYWWHLHFSVFLILLLIRWEWTPNFDVVQILNLFCQGFGKDGKNKILFCTISKDSEF